MWGRLQFYAAYESRSHWQISRRSGAPIGSGFGVITLITHKILHRLPFLFSAKDTVNTSTVAIVKQWCCCSTHSNQTSHSLS